MEIIVGVNSLDEIEYVLSRGAQEVYCGLSEIASHRMPRFSFSAIDQIYEAINIAHNKNKKIFLVVNEIYTKEEYKNLIRCLKNIIKKGIDGIIIRDFLLLLFLNQIKLNTYFILSSLALCFNQQTLQFYKKFRISRITLPQQLYPKEAEKLINNNFGIKSEIFFYPQCYCVNIDGLCFLHEQRLYKIISPDLPCYAKIRQKNRRFFMPKPSLSVHLENLYNFYKMGVDYLKISRMMNPGGTVATFNQASGLLVLLKNSLSKDEFIRRGLKLIDNYY